MQDSGYVNVNRYLQNGLNSFTFRLYNTIGRYTWGFELRNSAGIMFSAVDGVVGFSGANNGDTTRTDQFVYDTTVTYNIIICP